VRGWLPQGEQPPAPPTGEQRITGWLEPTEPDALRDPTREPLPDGDVQIISSPELLSLWRPPLFQGFVLQDQPPARAPLAQVSPPTRVVESTDWQNGAYAIQWWLFGVFAIFWFFRMVRVELEDQRANQQGGNGTEVPEHPGTIGRMDGADSTDADGTDSTEQKGSP
jgi:cytochrome oxidase assembly protein ShyY1